MRCKQRDRRPKILRRHPGAFGARHLGYKPPAPTHPVMPDSFRHPPRRARANVASLNDDHHQHNGRHKRPTPDPSRAQTTVIPAKARIRTGKPHGSYRNDSGARFPPPRE